MIETIDIQGAKAECCWFTLNANQQFAVIGCDKPIDVAPDIPGIDAVNLGKLDDQNYILEAQLINSLELQDWDFKTYPNPTVILLTDNRVSNVN